MKIDPKTMHHSAYRPFSLIGAVACALDNVPLGSSLLITEFVDAHGQKVPRARLDANIFKVKGDRVFMVRSSPDAFALIHRIA